MEDGGFCVKKKEILKGTIFIPCVNINMDR